MATVISALTDNAQTGGIDAVKGSVSILEYFDSAGKRFADASMFMIDESGYYVTAAHNLSIPLNILAGRIPAVRAGNLTTGTSHDVQFMLYNAESDVAFVFAPTGIEGKPLEGLSIRSEPLKTGEKLKMLPVRVGTLSGGKPIEIVHELEGIVDDLDPASIFQNQAGVRGMIPYGGSSGAPVVDMQGNIVGMESGPISDDITGKYSGARIARISSLDALADTCRGTAVDFF